MCNRTIFTIKAGGENKSSHALTALYWDQILKFSHYTPSEAIILSTLCSLKGTFLSLSLTIQFAFGQISKLPFQNIVHYKVNGNQVCSELLACLAKIISYWKKKMQ